MLARVVNMRGVDLRRFEFDYDLTWAAFFLDSQGRVLGRFGGRDAASPDTYLTLDGLKHAMAVQLAAFKSGIRGEESRAEALDGFTRPEEYPSAKRNKANACIHCHEVYHFRMDFHRGRGDWTRDRVWNYPPPNNLGITLDSKRQDIVKEVTKDSPASRAGLRSGDLLRELNGKRLASFADAQHALHLAPPTGRLAVMWQRDGKEHRGEIDLPARWRETDIAWRESMWHLEPVASVYGGDLSVEEKAKLGLGPKRLAFRQSAFVPPAARAAGIRAGDIILGLAGQDQEMTMLQFNAWVRLNLKVGDKVEYEVIRDGKRMCIAIVLPRRD